MRKAAAVEAAAPIPCAVQPRPRRTCGNTAQCCGGWWRVRRSCCSCQTGCLVRDARWHSVQLPHSPSIACRQAALAASYVGCVRPASPRNSQLDDVHCPHATQATRFARGAHACTTCTHLRLSASPPFLDLGAD
eukprot:6210618-Pleurochrysis_carterae.AAC.9